MPYDANKNELEILKFWQDNQIFEKSVSERSENKPYVFYDGPPFATGLPHYGHILGSVIKDVIPRYQTMKGFRVRRRWGWDCHGLPIENLVEKELEVSGKKQIEEKLGVEKFNETCRSKVLMYTKEWKKMVDRIGRWVEFDNSYKTMDSTYMESVWWALKTIWDKGLVYEGRKVLMYCPHCETPVSKAEVAMDDSYKDITEEAVVVKFRLRSTDDRLQSIFGIRSPKSVVSSPIYILAWTTTPWTLPGNVALAVGADIEYWILSAQGGSASGGDIDGENYIVAKDRVEAVAGDKRYEIRDKLKGSDLVGLEYEPLFDIPAIRETGKKAWYITDADFVTTEEGTGVVHTAVVYGEDDYNLGLKVGLPVVPLLNDAGHFNEFAPEFIRGQYFKKSEKLIKDDLENRGLLFARENHTHSYPHCWRCGTQLFYNAISAWFIDIQKIKKRLIKLNEKINWYPDHLKHGRFLNILETAPDWNISRNRYWATPLPFWRCEAENCDSVVCVGSVEELKKRAINFDEVYKSEKVEDLDLHKHLMDKIKLKCDKCGGEMSRTSEVIDCWVESASMPFAEWHYPFENKAVFEKRFPGQYIGEYIAQTRAWFYYMHVMATLLFDDISFENVVCTGTILNDKGEKLSKSKRNYTDPWVIIDQYGVDALRYYLMTSVVMQADDLYFNDREVRDVYNKVVNMLWNVVEFYRMYSNNVIPSESARRGGRRVEGSLSNTSDFAQKRDSSTPPHASSASVGMTTVTNVLDKWIMARLGQLVEEVTKNLDKYDTVRAGRPIQSFIDDLSTWYLRRSRDRFKGDNEEDKQAAIATLHDVLYILSKVIAPFMPFLAEKVYHVTCNMPARQALPGMAGGEHACLPARQGTKSESVHLENWPVSAEITADDVRLLQDMEKARKIVEMGLALRAEAGIKVRQPLSKLTTSTTLQLTTELAQIIAEELNVKNVSAQGGPAYGGENVDGVLVKEDGELKVALDTRLTDELKKEGLLREVVRAINQMRKEQKLTIQDRVAVVYQTDDGMLKQVFAGFSDEIRKGVLADELAEGENGSDAVDLSGHKVKLWIKR